MLLRRTRHVQILPLLWAVCHLALAFPIQTPPAHEEVRQLQVNIPHSGLVLTPLGSSISIPCFVSLSSSSSSSPMVPRVKWTVVSGGVETQILVVRGQRVKINDAYRDRAALFNYTTSPDDVSLWLGDLRHSDSGHYRCEVQQGLEDSSDIIQVKVNGVVFHYRDALGRYAFSFQQAQRACRSIGAQIATPDQLLSAYYDGYEQCDAGWLADQSVRYPIQVPREGCYGDMDGQPGVRNYGTMNPNDLYDVYCYTEQIDGEVFHDAVPQRLSFDEARFYCGAAGAELATTAQLYLAWSEGLDHCSPGWLADGSVRYPIVTPRERCGGPQAGVKTLYRFSNQTGFPEPFRLHDVYCFKENRKTSSDSPMDSVVTETEDVEQNVVLFMETDQEIQLNQQAEQVEREAQSVLESLPVLSSPFTADSLVDTHPTVTSDVAESSPNTTSALDLLQLVNETSETSLDSEHPTEAMNTTISQTETYNSTQSTSFSLGVYNQTHFHQNLSFTVLQSELERTTYKPHTENQTRPGINFEETTHLPEEHQELQNTSLSSERAHTNYSDTESSYTREESFWEATTITADPMLRVKLEEAAVEDLEQMSLSTQASQEKGTLSTHATQTTESAFETLTSLWDYVDASGDTSREKDVEVEEVTTSLSSMASFTTHLPHSSLASRAPAEQTAAPDFTLSPGSQYMDKVDSEVFSTSPHLWESSISRQEGSTSFETGDMETEEIQTLPTQSLEWVVSKVSLTMTESPEELNSSQSPSEFSMAQNETSSFVLYFDSSTSAEDASGYEPSTGSSYFQEDNKLSLAFEEQTTATPTHEEKDNVSLLMEQVNVAPTHVPEEAKVITTIFLKEETNGLLTVDEETMVTTTTTPEEGPKIIPIVVLEESAKVTQTLDLEEGAKVTPTKFDLTFNREDTTPSFIKHEDEASVSPIIKEVKVVPTYVLEEEGKVTQTLDLEEAAKVTPTKFDLTLDKEDTTPSFIKHEDEASVSPIIKEVKVVPTHVPEEEGKVVPTLDLGEESKVVTTLDFTETSKVVPTLEEETKVPSSLDIKGEANITPTIEEVKFAPTLVLKEDTKVAPTLVLEEVKVAPTLVLEVVEVASTYDLEEAAKVVPIFELEETTNADLSLDLEEEASAAPTMEEEVKVSPTLVLEIVKVASTYDLEEAATVVPILDLEEATNADLSLDLEEEASAAPTMEEEVNVAPTLVLEIVKVASTYDLEEAATVVPTLELEEATNADLSLDLEEEASAAPTIEEEVKVAPTLVLEVAKVASTYDLEEAAKFVTTLDLEEAINVDLSLDLEEEASAAPTKEEEIKVAPPFVLEGRINVAPTHTLEKVKVAPTHVLEKNKVTPTHALDKVKIAPTDVVEEIKVRPTHALEKIQVTQTLELAENEETHVATNVAIAKEKVAPNFVTENINVAPTSDFEEQTNIGPAHADFTVSPLDSQTSKWALMTTANGPQEPLNDVEFGQKHSVKAVSDALTTKTSTKPTAAPVNTISPSIITTTHRSQPIWSPTTTRPKSFHETIELQKVIPPVEHDLVDLEISLTKSPALFVLPNERAAVGGAGKSSDACLDDPCLNGGTCSDRDGLIKCLCLPTYGGDFCQTDLERCEPGWDKFHGFCYRHFSQRQSWEVAEQHCRMQGAHLVSIMTPEEQDYINSNYKEYQWTGLNDKTIEDDFRWSDGNPLLYENWYRGQPDSYFLSGEDCVVMVWHDSGRWSDVPCNYHLAYTCKKGTSSCGPPPKVRNASIFGKPRQKYETKAVVRYHCAEGFQQRRNPLIQCQSEGRWQRPQIQCIPEAGGSMSLPHDLSLTDSSFAAAENELEPTKEVLQYWDIKF